MCGKAFATHILFSMTITEIVILDFTNSSKNPSQIHTLHSTLYSTFNSSTFNSLPYMTPNCTHNHTQLYTTKLKIKYSEPFSLRKSLLVGVLTMVGGFLVSNSSSSMILDFRNSYTNSHSTLYSTFSLHSTLFHIPLFLYTPPIGVEKVYK